MDAETPRTDAHGWRSILAGLGWYSLYWIYSVVAYTIVLIALAPGESPADLANVTDDGDVIAVVVMILNLLLIATVLGRTWYRFRSTGSWTAWLGFSWAPLKTFAIGIAIAVALGALCEALNVWLGRPVPEWMQVAWRTCDYVALFALAIVIVGPAGEEILFRGSMFAAFRETRLGEWGTTVATALLWAALHVQYDLYDLSWIFAFGLVLGFVRIWSGSVAVTFLMHAVWNAGALVSLFFLASP